MKSVLSRPVAAAGRKKQKGGKRKKSRKHRLSGREKEKQSDNCQTVNNQMVRLSRPVAAAGRKKQKGGKRKKSRKHRLSGREKEKQSDNCQTVNNQMVRPMRLERTRPKSLPPQSSVSAYSTTASFVCAHSLYRIQSEKKEEILQIFFYPGAGRSSPQRACVLPESD